MKKFLLLLILFAISSCNLSHAASERITTKDTATIGSGTNVNKSLLFDIGSGLTNPGLLYKTADSSLNLNKNVFRFGDGIASDKTIISAIGLGGTDPKVRYNNTTDVFEFSNDGSTYADIGSGSGGNLYAWSGGHSSNCNFLYDGGGLTYIDSAIDASCTFTEILNKNFGSVTSQNDGTPGNNKAGIVFTPPAIGVYFICAQAMDVCGGGESNLSLTDGTTIIATSGCRDIGGSGYIVTSPMCGLLEISALTSKTIKLQGISTQNIQTTGGGPSPVYVINWSLEYVGE